MSNLLLATTVVAANVLGASMAFPQARRLARTRVVDGVSPAWVGVSVAMNAWWLAYGLAQSLWGLVPVSLISLLLYGSIASVVLSTAGRAAVPGVLAGALGLGALPLPALLLGGWSAAGLAIGVGYGVQLAPAVVTSYRTRQLDGVAPGTWVIAWVEAALWSTYGMAVIDPALLVAGAAGVAMASLILVRLATVQRRPWARPPRLWVRLAR